jgi:hypothetical protein
VPSIRKTIFLYQRQDGACVYCGIPLNENNATIDHVIPRTFDGEPSHSRNMVLSCATCNNKKATLENKVSTIEDLVALLRGKMLKVVSSAAAAARAREGKGDELHDPTFLSPSEIQARWEEENE